MIDYKGRMITLTIHKRIFAVVMAALLAAMCLTGCAVTKNASVIGTVNGENVTSDYYEYFMQSVQQEMIQDAKISTPEEANKYWDTEIDGKKAIDVLRQKAFDEIAKLYVEVQKAKEMGIAISDEDSKQITSAINNAITQSGGKAAYEASLKEMGLTATSYRNLMEMFWYASKLQEKIMADDKQYEISDEDAKKYAENQEKITAKHILFSTQDSETGEPLSDEKKAEMKSVAEEALEKIKSGAEKFDDVMNDLSQDPGLASNPNGYTFGKGEMVKEFEDAAFALKEGEMSDIVESDFGYHIIKREPRVIEESDISSAKEEMQADLYDKQVEKWVNDSKLELNEKEAAKFEPKKYDQTTSDNASDAESK